jgi:molecular chaperone DnaK (HSP70)
LFQEIGARYDEHGFNQNHFIQHSNEEMQRLFIDLMTFPYNLDNWERKEIYVDSEEKKLRRAVMEAIYAYKSKRVERMIKECQQMLKDAMELGGDVEEFLRKQIKLEEVKREINRVLGRTVLH